jgi:hypothetical protein
VSLCGEPEFVQIDQGVPQRRCVEAMVPGAAGQ